MTIESKLQKTGETFRPDQFDWDDACLPPEQINWLSTRLSLNRYKRTFILSHQNLDHRLWNGQIDPHIISNADQIRTLIESKDQKITVIQGHYHHGYFQKINDTSYFTLSAMCEGGSMKNNSYAILDLYDDGRLIANGYGDQATVVIEAGDQLDQKLLRGKPLCWINTLKI